MNKTNYASLLNTLRKKTFPMKTETFLSLDPKVKSLIDTYPSIFLDVKGRPIDFYLPVGWSDLMHELLSGLAKAGGLEGITVRQIKEKFGGLRFYAEGLNQVQRSLVSQSEEKSFSICVVCGSRGERLMDDYLVTVLCQEHAPGDHSG